MMRRERNTQASARTGFTLFELILAIALSAVLLGLIGMAINLYLKRIDMSRTRVEEAQLARSILSMVADDLRATSVYQPQDISSVAKLMANGTPFDVDSIDEEDSGSAAGGGGASSDDIDSIDSPSTGGGSSGGSSGSGGSGGGIGGSSSGGGGSESGSSSESESGTQDTMPLGVNGSQNELYVDVDRLPSGDELFNTYTGYTNAPMAMQDGATAGASANSQSTSISHPSDLKTVRYFVREGVRESSGIGATSLAKDAQLQGGGLVRQEISRPERVLAEEMGDSSILDSGQVLIAPEIVHMEFNYYDGEQIVNLWDMTEEKQLPRAVEVCIWVASPTALAAVKNGQMSADQLLNSAREYRQTVFLPMAELSQSSGTGASSSASSSSSSTTSGASSTGTSSLGSGLGGEQ